MKGHKKEGYLLVEVLVAIAVITIALVALVARVTSSLSAARFTSDQAQANRLAQQAVEWLRSYKDEMPWTTYRSTFTDGTYCWNDLPTTLNIPGSAGNCTAANPLLDGLFTRELVLNTHPGPEEGVDYDLTISWTDGSRSPSVQVNGTLYRNSYD